MAYFRCTVCDWVYDESAEGTPFAEQPEDYACPICAAPKDMFVEEN
jgi:pyruvate oxidase